MNKLLCCSLVLVFLGSMAFADCGSAPMFTLNLFGTPVSAGGYGARRYTRREIVPLLTKDANGQMRVSQKALDKLKAGELNLDPLKVEVYEPGQRGIILWNGEEERLLLSTDISTSQPASILEVIPMPSEPKVRLGKYETFVAMEQLMLEKEMWTVAAGGGTAQPIPAAKVTFQEKMGAHDVAVVQVYDGDRFESWVMEFFKSKGAINPALDPRLVQIIQNYVNRGYEWFVFDTIDTTDKVQSKQPLEYTFKTDQVYYPLEISTLETGTTDVNLMIVTQEKITEYPDIKLASSKKRCETVTQAELSKIDAEWGRFMPSEECTVQRVRIKGKLKKMDQDFLAH